jgi:hypothetical protein
MLFYFLLIVTSVKECLSTKPKKQKYLKKITQ